MSEDPRSDQELLRAHVAGDPDAFGVLFTRHRDRLWAVALRTMGNPHDAADGLQDGLIAAYRRAGSFRGDAAVTTWLHRVIVNACLDRLRAAKVRRTETLPDTLPTHQTAGHGGAAHDRAGHDRAGHDRADRGSAATVGPIDPAEAAIEEDRRRAVLRALSTLPAEQRAALVLVDMEGYPVAEVAVMLDVAEGTVKSRCSRGRARLADLLVLLVAPDGDPAPDDPRNPMPGSAVRSGEHPRGPPD